MPLQPFVRLITAQPALLVDHLEAYAALVNDEVGMAASNLKRQALLSAIAIVLLCVGAILGGVALMLWAVVASPSNAPLWVLAVVPAVPVVAALVCLASRGEMASPFVDLRKQFAADLSMLREATTDERR